MPDLDALLCERGHGDGLVNAQGLFDDLGWKILNFFGAGSGRRIGSVALLGK
jgi:hypothetical protein